MLTSSQYTALASEIANDPESMGYATYVSDGQDAAIANLLNSLTSSGAASVPSDPMSRDQVLLNLAPAAVALAGLSSDIQAKWDRILGILQAASFLSIGDSSVQGLFADAVTDGVLTSDQTEAFPATRTGSRAEVLFGNGTVIQDADVAIALGR